MPESARAKGRNLVDIVRNGLLAFGGEFVVVSVLVIVAVVVAALILLVV